MAKEEINNKTKKTKADQIKKEKKKPNTIKEVNNKKRKETKKEKRTYKIMVGIFITLFLLLSIILACLYFDIVYSVSVAAWSIVVINTVIVVIIFRVWFIGDKKPKNKLKNNGHCLILPIRELLSLIVGYLCL